MERCRRTGHQLSLALVDLDEFKQVNERHGHLAGDEVLRDVGRALRHGVRAYDLVARYGGDEFAIVAIGAGEAEAAEVARQGARRRDARARRVRPAGRRGRRDGRSGRVGRPEENPTSVIERADRALLYGEAAGGARLHDQALPRLPGTCPALLFGPRPAASAATTASSGPTSRASRPSGCASAPGSSRSPTRSGARLAAMTDPRDDHAAAVEELHRAFGYYLCAIMRIRADDYVEGVAGLGEPFIRLVDEQGWCQPRDAGLIGRCLRERRPVMTGDVMSEPEYVFTERDPRRCAPSSWCR